MKEVEEKVLKEQEEVEIRSKVPEEMKDMDIDFLKTYLRSQENNKNIANQPSPKNIVIEDDEDEKNIPKLPEDIEEMDDENTWALIDSLRDIFAEFIEEHEDLSDEENLKTAPKELGMRYSKEKEAYDVLDMLNYLIDSLDTRKHDPENPEEIKAKQDSTEVFLAYVSKKENAKFIIDSFVDKYDEINDNNEHLGIKAATRFIEGLRNLQGQILPGFDADKTFGPHLKAAIEKKQKDSAVKFDVKEYGKVAEPVHPDEKKEEPKEEEQKVEQEEEQKVEQEEVKKEQKEVKKEQIELDDVEVFLENAYNLNALYDDCFKTLFSYREKFFNAQVNTEANRYSYGAQEGPEDYRILMRDLNNFLNDLAGGKKSSKLTIREFSSKFNALMKKAIKYKNDHKPRFRNHTSEESAKRYEIIQDFIEYGRVMAKASLTYYEKLEKDFENMTGQRLDDVKVVDLSQKFVGDEAIEKAFKADNRNTDEFYKNLERKKDKVIENNKQDAFDAIIIRNLKTAMSDNPYLNMEQCMITLSDRDFKNIDQVIATDDIKDVSWRDFDVKQNAQAYVANKYLALANKIGEGDSSKWAETIYATKPSVIKEEVDKLASNDNFKKLVAIDPKRAFCRWGKVLVHENHIKNVANRTLNSFRNGEAPEGEENKISKKMINQFVLNSIIADPENAKALELHCCNMYLSNKPDEENSVVMKHVAKKTAEVLTKKNIYQKYENKDLASMGDMINDLKNAGILSSASSLFRKVVDKRYSNKVNKESLKEDVKMYNESYDLESPAEVLNKELKLLNDDIVKYNNTIKREMPEERKKYTKNFHNYIKRKYGNDEQEYDGSDHLNAFLKISQNKEAQEQRKLLSEEQFKEYLENKFDEWDANTYIRMINDEGTKNKYNSYCNNLKEVDNEIKSTQEKLKKANDRKTEINKEIKEFNKTKSKSKIEKPQGPKR